MDDDTRYMYEFFLRCFGELVVFRGFRCYSGINFLTHRPYLLSDEPTITTLIKYGIYKELK